MKIPPQFSVAIFVAGIRQFFSIGVVTLILFLVTGATHGRAAVLIETPGPLASDEARPVGGFLPTLGHMARVEVGPDPVQIGGISVFGQVLANTRLEWAIFPDFENAAPQLLTAPVSFAPSGPREWFASPQFATPFTLRANTTYWIGFIAGSPLNSFRMYFNDMYPGEILALTQNGLTIPGAPAGAVLALAANPRGSFTAPTIALGTSSVQLGIRLHTFPVPEPSALLLAIGACGCLCGRGFRK